MSRVEENQKVIEFVDEGTKDKEIVEAILNNPQYGLYISAGAIATVLMDISKSLAVIADSLQQNNCDTQGESE